jgi:hypothetical protein
MDVFKLRDRLVEDYSAYVRIFMTIRDDRIAGVSTKTSTLGSGQSGQPVDD